MLLLLSMSSRFSLWPSKSYTVLALTWLFNHVELICIHNDKVRFHFHCLACGNLIFLTPFVEKVIFPIEWFCHLCWKIIWLYIQGFISGISVPVSGLYVHLDGSIPVLKSESVRPPNLLFIFKIVSVICSALRLHLNIRMGFSSFSNKQKLLGFQ